MTDLTACGRKEQFAGTERSFDLGQPYVMAVLSGNIGAVPLELNMRRGLPAGPVLDGQFGDTPAACLKRFENGVYSIQDIEILLILGLWGGGMPISKAIELVDKTVVGKPLGDYAALAFRIIAGLFVGGKNVSAAA